MWYPKSHAAAKSNRRGPMVMNGVRHPLNCTRFVLLFFLFVVGEGLSTGRRTFGGIITPANPNLVVAVFEGKETVNSSRPGEPMRAYVYYDKTVPLSYTASPGHTDVYRFESGVNMGLGVSSSSGSYRSPPGTEIRMYADHPQLQYYPDAGKWVDSFRAIGPGYSSGISLSGTHFPQGYLPAAIPAFDPTDPYSFLLVPHTARGSINTSRAMTANDILGGSLQALPSGPTMNMQFEPFGGAMSLRDAAILLGYNHFNYAQVVQVHGVDDQEWLMSDANGNKLKRFFDHPPGGYFWGLGSSREYVPADAYPFYYDYTANESPLNWQTDYSFVFQDTPGWELLDRSQDKYFSFTTMLVGVKEWPQGSTPQWHVLDSFSWKSDYTRAGAGGVFKSVDILDPMAYSGGIFDVSHTGTGKLSNSIIDLIHAHGGSVISDQQAQVVPEPSSLLIWVISMLSLAGLRAKAMRVTLRTRLA